MAARVAKNSVLTIFEFLREFLGARSESAQDGADNGCNARVVNIYFWDFSGSTLKYSDLHVQKLMLCKADEPRPVDNSARTQMPMTMQPFLRLVDLEHGLERLPRP